MIRSAVRGGLESYLQATSGLRDLPDFIVIGCQRGGTTSLYRYLSLHPCVAPTVVSKGVHYFDVHRDRALSWYRGHFPPSAYRRWRSVAYHQPTITGEASPYYLFHPLVPEQVAHAVPDARLIAVLRDPVKRAFSHYHHEREGGFEDRPTFEEALDAEDARLDGEVARMRQDPSYASFSHQHHSYVSRGRYAEQLDRWFTLFPEERILLLTSEEFYGDTAATFAVVERFLGIPSHPIETFKTYNAHTYDPMDPATLERLRATFREPNERLAERLGRDPGWS
jgi:Sulfotransferase domain